MSDVKTKGYRKLKTNVHVIIHDRNGSDVKNGISEEGNKDFVWLL